jgi:hypothetical protein
MNWNDNIKNWISNFFITVLLIAAIIMLFVSVCASQCSTATIVERWIHNGNFQKELDDGYNFYVGCGRFRTEPCKCHKCRKGKGKKLQEVIDRHYTNAT